VVDDPTGGFQMKTDGWGNFRLKAIVYLENGKTEMLTHDVELKRTPPKGRTDETS
jgi:transcription initiation factor IIF auxiliary subunit